MNTKILLVAGIIAATFVLSGCQTKNGESLTSVKRTTVVTPGSTNITMVEEIDSSEKGKYNLKRAAIDGRTQVRTARANRPTTVVVNSAGGGNYPDNMNPGGPGGNLGGAVISRWW